MVTGYFLLKTMHILFVMAWLAVVFVLPRVIFFYHRSLRLDEHCDGLRDLAYRLFRFGCLMFVGALSFGAALAVQYAIRGNWLALKIGFVWLLLAYFLLSGHFIHKWNHKSDLPAAKYLRIFNEMSLLLVLPIIYLAVAKLNSGL